MAPEAGLSVGDLQAYLRARGIAGEIVRLEAHTPTVEAAAQVVGVPVERIAKSVLFLVEWPTGHLGVPEPVLVIANGTHKVDTRRVAEHLGAARKRLRLAAAPAVLAATGYPVGAVPPLGHPAPLRTLMDRRVLAQPEVYAGGGALDALLRIAPADIQAAAQAEVVDVVADAA